LGEHKEAAPEDKLSPRATELEEEVGEGDPALRAALDAEPPIEGPSEYDLPSPGDVIDLPMATPDDLEEVRPSEDPMQEFIDLVFAPIVTSSQKFSRTTPLEFFRLCGKERKQKVGLTARDIRKLLRSVNVATSSEKFRNVLAIIEQDYGNDIRFEDWAAAYKVYTKLRSGGMSPGRSGSLHIKRASITSAASAVSMRSALGNLHPHSTSAHRHPGSRHSPPRASMRGTKSTGAAGAGSNSSAVPRRPGGGQSTSRKFNAHQPEGLSARRKPDRTSPPSQRRLMDDEDDDRHFREPTSPTQPLRGGRNNNRSNPVGGGGTRSPAPNGAQGRGGTWKKRKYGTPTSPGSPTWSASPMSPGLAPGSPIGSPTSPGSPMLSRRRTTSEQPSVKNPIRKHSKLGARPQRPKLLRSNGSPSVTSTTSLGTQRFGARRLNTEENNPPPSKRGLGSSSKSTHSLTGDSSKTLAVPTSRRKYRSLSSSPPLVASSPSSPETSRVAPVSSDQLDSAIEAQLELALKIRMEAKSRADIIAEAKAVLSGSTVALRKRRSKSLSSAELGQSVGGVGVLPGTVNASDSALAAPQAGGSVTPSSSGAGGGGGSTAAVSSSEDETY